jgi:predicted aspartyl protease
LVGGGNAAGSYVRFFTSLDALPFGRVASFIWLVSASALIGFLAFNASMKARNASLGICANVRMLGNAKFAGDVEVGRGRTGVESTDSGIYAWVNVANGSVAERWLNMKLQLDTGATYTKISKRKLKFLGAKPVGTVIETLADGRKIKRKYGLVYMECCGEGSFASVVFGEKRDAEVLGMTAAHALGLLRELRRQAGQTTAQQAPVPVQQTTAPAQQTVACQQAPVQAPKTVEPVVLFKELACEDCMEARERIYKAGFAAVYLGKNALTDKHVFLPVAYELAKALASGEKVASKDKEVKEALERLVLAGYLDEVDEGFRMKSEDVKRDLEVQVMRLRELYLKRATGYVV